MSPTNPAPDSARAPTGIAGLDDILAGGLPTRRFYLVQGDPGTGKTTLALQFLLEGVRRGEAGVYVTLSESEEELRGVAQSHGWDLGGISLFELSTEGNRLKEEEQNTLFQPAEIELGETVRSMMTLIERVKPTRIALDSLSEMRLLAQDALRYRRRILALKQFFANQGATVLMLDDRTSDASDIQLRSLAHGVIEMEQLAPGFGAERRRLRVVKLRGSRFRGGYHDYNIKTGGLDVFPRLVAAEHMEPSERGTVASGLPSLDALLGGGLDRGTSTLFMGPAGIGKSVLSTLYAKAMADRGEHVAYFAFDESRAIFLGRARSLGMSLDEHVEQGRIRVQQVDPAELSPGEFVHEIRRQVEDENMRLVVIDSLNGLSKAMLEERFLATQLHELLSYLSQRGVVTLLLLAQHGMLGSDMQSPVDLSYLADTVLLLRFFELGGEIRKALSVVKKRTGNHEKSIREIRMGRQGVTVGDVLQGFRGILTGVPQYAADPLPTGGH